MSFEDGKNFFYGKIVSYGIIFEIRDASGDFLELHHGKVVFLGTLFPPVTHLLIVVVDRFVV